MSTVTKDTDFDMEELVDFDDAVTTALKESGIAPITKADMEVKEERVKGDVKVVESMFGSIAIQSNTSPTDSEFLNDSEPKTILTTLSQEAQAQLNFERAKAVAGGCSECGRPHSISRCLWIKDCVTSGLLVKQVKLGRKFPIYNLVCINKQQQILSDAFIANAKVTFETRKIAYMVSTQVFPIVGSEEVPLHLRPSQPVECPEYTILSKPVAHIALSCKQAALMLP